ncbi:MAG: hypothetical protein MJ209_02960 [archaeon]|nr:hypothetical protein [archaeon]
MDEFFQVLRNVQKKERNNGTLARVEDTFYQDIHNYLDELRSFTGNDPFSQEYQLLKDIQRIATEICERREHKISDAAVVNIHRSYHLFTGKPKFDLVDTTPLNLTPEEEKFYFSLIDSLTSHRKNISLEKFSDNDEEEEPVEKPLTPKVEPIKKEIPKVDSPKVEEDTVLNRIDNISSAKTITDEKYEPIEKQVNKSNPPKSNIPKERVIVPEEEEFVDFESQKMVKDSELVTILIFDNINQIIAVDNRIYGPFYPQDLVVMPKINAKIFAKSHKGRIVNI